MPSHLRPRPGTASAVGRLSIGRLVGSQCNFDQSSIVARMSSRAMQNGRSWVKKCNLGQKNATLAEKPGFPALPLSVSIERGLEFGKIFSGWQIILLRHTGDFQKSALIMTIHTAAAESVRVKTEGFCSISEMFWDFLSLALLAHNVTFICPPIRPTWPRLWAYECYVMRQPLRN